MHTDPSLSGPPQQRGPKEMNYSSICMLCQLYIYSLYAIRIKLSYLSVATDPRHTHTQIHTILLVLEYIYIQLTLLSQYP